MGKILVLATFIAMIGQNGYASFTDISKAPPSFKTSTGAKAVFIDVENATYDINYDLIAKTAFVQTTFHFTTTEKGFPIFDSVAVPTKINLDDCGCATQTVMISSPDSTTSYRMIDAEVEAGKHTIQMVSPILTGVKFDTTGVRSGFFTSDLDDREFLEAYMPSNLEFDQYQMTYRVTFNGLKTDQDFFTNGVVTKNSDSMWTVTYPNYFNTSSAYFHTAPKGFFKTLSKNFKSIDGREIPVVVYGTGSGLEGYMRKAQDVFNELEGTYGPWLHPSLIIYGAGSGGMEYCGATITELWALGHEMTHSYFARGFMPANGDSGWMDEAIASWRDDGYPRHSQLTTQSDMGNQSAYLRITDMRAYTEGADFIGHLDFLSANNGGLKKFLAGLVQNHSFNPTFTQDFQSLLESFNGKSLENVFNTAIYGKKGKGSSKQNIVNPYHPKLTREQLDSLL